MSSPQKFAHTIHSRAIQVARQYRTAEIELIDVLQEIDRHKIYLHHGCNSLFSYVTDIMGLSQEVAAIYIAVARKATEVPALKTEIREGRITVTKARRIASVLKPSNQTHWLELARTSSKQKLEKEVAMENPKVAIRDQLTFASHPVDRITLKKKVARVQFQAGISEDLMLRIRRAQDLISQRKRRSVDLEEVLDTLVQNFLSREDPVEKAKRAKLRGDKAETSASKKANKDVSREDGNISMRALPKQCPGTITKTHASTSRTPLTAKEKHAVFLKHKGQCSFELHGKRCHQRRFLEIHHIRPIAKGGTNDPLNLELLCSGHHQAKHLAGIDP